MMARRLALLLTLLAVACGGPSRGGRSPVDEEPPPPEIQSNDILSRDAVTMRSRVKHVLIGWRDLAAAYPDGMDERAAARTRDEADALALQVLGRVRAGEPIEPIMAEISEDSGSAASGDSYEVTAEARLVFEFKRLGLRLEVGEAGLVMSQYGWHVMKRVE